jgi:ribulokinase
MVVNANNLGGERYAVGVDFGTLSGRALVVRVSDGAEVGTAVHEYAHGVMDEALPTGPGSSGTALKPDWALQHPDDYREVLRRAVPAAVADAGIDPAEVIGVGIDFTACTVLPALADGTPLCELDEYRGRPHAYVKLWKHHAAQPQADRINALAHKRAEPWIARYGGKISSEWEYAKGLQLLEEDPELYARAERWIEAADWITWQLCGVETRNACTAGYKGVLQDGARPSRAFLIALNPGFADFDAKLDLRPGEPAVSALGTRAGSLTAEAAAWTGLPEGIAVSVGNVDAHVTAPAAQAVEPGQMVAIMGTSTCHVMNGGRLAEVPGMCGVVDGGIVAGLWGYEAGQSGVGDIFAWFTEQSTPGEVAAEAAARGISVHDLLTERAAAQPDRPGLAQRQPLGAGGPPPVRRDRRAHSRHEAARGLPRADGGHRLRHPGHHRVLRGRRRAGHRVRRRRRAAQERVPDAAVRRRDPPPAEPDRLGAGPRARLGDPRRGGRRGVPGRARRRARDGEDSAGGLHARPRAGRRVRRPLRRVPAASRLLRPRRERGAAPAARDPSGRARGSAGRCFAR